MFFCPKCKYSLDISRNISNDKTVKIITAPKIFINQILENKLSNIRINFTEKELKKEKEFNKLDSKNKQILLDEFSNSLSNNINTAYFECKTCQYITQIKPGTIIYKSSKTISDKTINNFDKYCSDKTLPRTKDFICPNAKCVTNKKSEMANKEAIFFRQKSNSYELTYLCCSCNTSWNP